MCKIYYLVTQIFTENYTVYDGRIVGRGTEKSSFMNMKSLQEQVFRQKLDVAAGNDIPTAQIWK